MILRQIALSHFRNQKKAVYSFDPHLTVILGENARGKTNLLEAVYFVMNGVGFRESREEELMEMGEQAASVDALFLEEGEERAYRIHLAKRGVQVEKTYFYQKTKQKHYQYLQDQTRAILFAPEQIDIIIGPPEVRRAYLNKRISMGDPAYRTKLINLESAVRRRNKVLERVSDESRLRDELKFWNEYIVEQGSYITKRREEYLAYINLHPHLENKHFSVTYEKSEVSLERFAAVFEEERRYRRTMIGPQKDDFVISLGESKHMKDVHCYGSRSEQRLAVFWLKMNEITYYEDHYHKRPLLLLDDVFSEFDKQNRKLILDLIPRYQTVLTTTEEEILTLTDEQKAVIPI